MGSLISRGPWMAVAALVFLTSCQSISILNPSVESSAKLDKTDKDTSLPGKYSTRVSQFVFYSDFELPKTQPIFTELAAMRESVYKELQLPPSNTQVQVYLFEDRNKYETYMRSKYPNLPKRRAFFVAQPKRFGGADDLLVYTTWGDRVQQDLRHELTHALLHASIKQVPLWLDEGLAEYFEMPTVYGGVNYQHLEAMQAPGFKFDLDRLERISDVQQMTPSEYREAWAWTHLMLRTTPEAKQVLLSYLSELRGASPPGSLKQRLARVIPGPEDAVRRHVADLDLTKKRDATASAK